MAPKKAPTKLNELKDAPYNPRDISPDAFQALGYSLHEFGDISGIVWNRRTGNLVTGHQRLEVLKQRYGDKLKLQQGKVVTPDGEKFPIRVVDWAATKEKAANIAANSGRLQGTFGPELSSVVQAIQNEMPDLADMLELPLIEAPAVLPQGELEDHESPVPKMELQPFEHYDYIIVLARNRLDWDWLCNKLGLDSVNASPISGKKKIGLGRAVDATGLIRLLRERDGGQLQDCRAEQEAPS